MAVYDENRRKVETMFRHFDQNGDGGLNRDEMAALVIAVNRGRVRFSKEQVDVILDEVFKAYGAFIEANKGLSLDGLLRLYADGSGDVDRDFVTLGLELDPPPAVALLGPSHGGEAQRALQEALRSTNRVEIDDFLAQLRRRVSRKNRRLNQVLEKAEASQGFIVAELGELQIASEQTPAPLDLAQAVELRTFQEVARRLELLVGRVEKERREPPPQFLCCITKEVMREPVVAADGQSYERAAIEDWLHENSTSPITREVIAGRGLHPNYQLRSLISEWKLEQQVLGLQEQQVLGL